MSSSSFSAVFGLHVGNTNACIAVSRDGRSEVVANPSGDRVTPAAVGWRQTGERGSLEVLTGLSAKQLAFRFPKAVVSGGNKQVLGITATTTMNMSDYNGKDGPKLVVKGDQIHYEIEPQEGSSNKKATPGEVHTHILKYMHDIALSQLSGDDDMDDGASDSSLSCVLTVPSGYNSAQRTAAVKCAEKAGFTVAQVISEEAAALLAHGVGQGQDMAEEEEEEEAKICVVYRAGGRSVTCSVVRVHRGIFTIMASKEVQGVGGEVLRNNMAQFLANEFRRKYRLDPCESRRAMEKLRRESESVIRVLSTLDSAPVHVESLMDGLDFGSSVNRARFEAEVVSKSAVDFASPLQSALDSAGVDSGQVHKLVLCGGATKVAKIKKTVISIIPKAEVLSDPNSDESIAVGASTQAALLSCSSKRDVLQSTGNRTEKIKALNGSIIYLIDGKDGEKTLVASGVPIPTRRSCHIGMVEGGACKVTLYFANKLTNHKTLLAKLELTKLASSSGCSPSSLTSGGKALLFAHVHRNGSLHLGLSDKTTSRADHKTLQPPEDEENKAMEE